MEEAMSCVKSLTFEQLTDETWKKHSKLYIVREAFNISGASHRGEGVKLSNFLSFVH